MSEVASTVDVPISGIGGITDWQSAVEYMMLGATTVQVGMGAMVFGYELVQDMLKGLQEFMERKSYTSPRDFIGLSYKKVAGLGREHVPPALKLPWHNAVNRELCNGCGLCTPKFANLCTRHQDVVF